MKTVECLPDRRIIRLFGEVDTDAEKDIEEALAQLNNEDKKGQIFLQINSVNGEMKAGLNIYHMIQLSKAPVIGTVVLHAFGPALVVLQGCLFRGAFAHAEIFIHYDRSNKLQNSIDEIYRHRSGYSIATAKDLFGKSTAMSAYKALEYGLIDRVL